VDDPTNNELDKMKPTSITKIPDNLTEKEHREIAEKLSSLNIDGIELSDVGGRWGATWETQKNYNLDFLKFYKGGYFAPKYTTYFGVKYTINFGGKYTTFLEVSLINFGPSLPVMRSWI
jgi:hypothetical protein